jgi:hypothetical protein
MKRINYWSIDRLALMIVQILLNKFDAFIVIEGNRGLGKSTLGFKILKKVNNFFRIIQREMGDEFKDWYKFQPKMQLKNPFKYRFIIYKKDDVLNFFNEWHKSCIADEMINVAFNRDFWEEDQKNVIKLVNMNRDHGNLFVACVPQFQTLDNQIKNLCKIRITVCRRGLAVIQTPNRTIYNRDKWDSANNERIEREWLKKGSGLPQYSKLNTFRGMLRFSKLNDEEQSLYDAIKISERNIIAKDLGVTDKKEEIDPVDSITERLLSGGVRNSAVIDGFGLATGLPPQALKEKIRRKLEKMGKPTSLGIYYWDKKAKSDQEFIGIT